MKITLFLLSFLAHTLIFITASLFIALVSGCGVNSSISDTKASESEYVTSIQTEKEFHTIIANDQVVLVDFYADWCGPCRDLKPTIHQLASEYKGKIRVIAVDVDKFQKLAVSFGVSEIPNVRIFKSGKDIRTIKGLSRKEVYVKAIRDAL